MTPSPSLPTRYEARVMSAQKGNTGMISTCTFSGRIEGMGEESVICGRIRRRYIYGCEFIVSKEFSQRVKQVHIYLLKTRGAQGTLFARLSSYWQLFGRWHVVVDDLNVL